MLIKACKPALESSYVTKVIHDCKRDSEVSDCFFFYLNILHHGTLDMLYWHFEFCSYFTGFVLSIWHKVAERYGHPGELPLRD